MTSRQYDKNASRSRFKSQKRRQTILSRRILIALVAVAAVAAAAVVLALLAAPSGDGADSRASGGALGASDLSVPSGPSAGADGADGTEGADGANGSAAGEAVAEQGAEAREPYDLSWTDVLSLPGSGSVVAFDLRKPSVQEAYTGPGLASIDRALAAIREYGSCGFVFIDIETGRGLSFNADEVVYIASSSKAVLAYYALQHGAAGNDYERSLIESAIRVSDNGAFEGFGYSYANAEYGDWLNAHDVHHSDFYYDLYPPMSARSLASFWAEIYPYLQSGSEDAEWFAGLLSSTSVSFIRAGLSDTGAAVMNKAGWIAEEGYLSTSDSAIVLDGGRAYLMTIVTSQPAWDVTEANVSALARALFDVRADLK